MHRRFTAGSTARPLSPSRRRILVAGARVAGAFALAGLSAPVFAAAEGIEPREITLTPREDGYVLTAEFLIEVSPRLEDALQAVPLFFVFDYEINRRRWYWWDEDVARGSITYRLSYNALTREYRLALSSQGASLTALTFSSLPEALRFMSRVRRERVAEPGALKPGERYRVGVRLRLDTAQLPKPFQLNALTQREWLLDSDIKYITVAGNGGK
ncbi:MAG: DUF4390 domain-containing protein [Burkholderiaceae bacterium]